MSAPPTIERPYEILLDGKQVVGRVYATNQAEAVRLGRNQFPTMGKRLTARWESAE